MRQRLLIGAVVTMAVCGWYAAYRTVVFTTAIAGELERAIELASIRPRAQSTIVLDRDGQPAFTFYAEQRIDVPLARVSPRMIEAIVAVEDRRFYAHYGLDPIRIAGAALRNVRAGAIREGGSTITQQLARAGQLSPARTFERKIREAAIALRLEERYTKAEILEAYLNTVYFGEGFYGVEAAARGYFGKAAADLGVAEAALLAALVRSPSTDAPCVAPERALRRRNLVLRLMRNQQRISDTELSAAARAPLPDPAHERAALASAANGAGAYFQEEIRRQLVAMFGADRVLRGGLRVHSTYDGAMQAAAEQAIRSRLAEISRPPRRGEKPGPAANLQGSLVALDPATGDVLALVGGRDFAESPFNRATQARRQAGSAFKPILYAAALERGYAPGSMLRDLDLPIEGADGEWLPGGEHEQDEYTLRAALKMSSNRAAAQLIHQVGVGTTIYYAHRLGIGSRLPDVPSLALGTGEVTLMELTAAYGVFANRGVLAAPRLITRVDDADGTVIWSAPIETTRAISETNAFLMSSMLSDVVSGGTAAGARAAGFRLPAGGKTGTTDDYADAWFIGYTPHLVAGVWFGLDTPAPIMQRGFAGVVAVPAWARFMKAATAGAKAEWFAVPQDVEKVAICRRSGARATDACRRALTESIPVVEPDAAGLSWPLASPKALAIDEPVYEDYFPVGLVPPDLCPIHSVPQGVAGDLVSAASDVPVRVTRTYRPDGSVSIVMKGGGE
ncbi:MAG TPA: PBP1A family penicillin-binding protein [Vicinamibacterales bacterium]|nr:PBP1A family penicillin-binding protein [Vicinamibacterales bacterium]